MTACAIADWIAAVSQLDPPLPPSELPAAQQDAARQGAQNYAYAQLLRQVRDRVRQHDNDAVVIGSVGLPTFPARWMHWFEQHLDAAFMEGFITAEQSGARAHDFAVHTGLFNPPRGSRREHRRPRRPSPGRSWSPASSGTLPRPAAGC